MGVSGDNASDPGVSPLSRGRLWRKGFATLLRFWGVWLIALLLLLAPPFFEAVRKPAPPNPQPRPRQDAAPRPPVAVGADLQQLQSALRAGDDEAILAFFRSRGLSDEEQARARKLVDRLASPVFRDRLRASEELAAMGPRAASVLRYGLSHADPELASRARELLRRGVREADLSLLVRAVEHLGQTHPPGTIEALLHYLPSAESASLGEAIRHVLVKLTPRDTVPDPALVRALEDASAERRSQAGVALAQARADEHLLAVRRLLQDADRDVRRRVALALVGQFDRQAVPTLIDLLGELPPAEAWPVIDLLYQLAGSSAPATRAEADPRLRHRFRTAWKSWWEQAGERIELATSNLQLPGQSPTAEPTLVVFRGERARSGTVELTRPGQSSLQDLTPAHRWGSPVWAEQQPGGGVLVVDYGEGAVLELSESGKEETSIHRPLAVFAQKLRSGNTFVACRDGLWEIESRGRTAWMHPWPLPSIVTARPCSDGLTLVLTDDGTCRFIDREGLERSRFQTGCTMILAPGIDVTADRRVIVPDIAGNRVVEFSPSGEVLWQLNVTRPSSAQRLPNGHTLVVSGSHTLREFDRLGRQTWSQSLERPALVARRPTR